jgi:heme-degrading monooxygenase HmoA
MFAYILSAPNAPSPEQSDDFFRRFSQTPGLLHAFDLEPADGSGAPMVVAVWESREAAEAYLSAAPLRKEVDEAIPQVTRTMYNVRASK